MAVAKLTKACSVLGHRVTVHTLLQVCNSATILVKIYLQTVTIVVK